MVATYALPGADPSFRVCTQPDSVALDKVFNWLEKNAFWVSSILAISSTTAVLMMAYQHGGRSHTEFLQYINTKLTPSKVADTSVTRQVSNGAAIFLLTKEGSDEPLGFARAAGDTIRLAYVSDVYVAESLRGQGLGSTFAEHVFNHAGRWNWRWLLHAEAETAKWYERRFGFTIVGKSPISAKIGKDIRLLERLPLSGEPVAA